MKRPLSFSYLFFYTLFWKDTWQLLFGFLAAILIAPRIAKPEYTIIRMAMTHVMVAAIGYVAFAKPARLITDVLKGWVLKKNPH